jgi:phosphoglycerate kinase
MIVREKLQNCQTIFWNGPMGIYEKTLFETGTKFVGFFLSEMGKNNNTTTIVGGGDSMAVLKKYNLQNKITHISSGGGAFMRLFEHSSLPALESLK